MTSANTIWDGAFESGLSSFQAAVESTCLGFIDSQADLLDDLGEDGAALVAAARRSLTGGKRLRAAFCWWGYQAVQPATDGHALLHACASLEFLHASALVHDDYMDSSATRRGFPATHRAFADRHRELGWSGDPEMYGASAAILLGDVLLSWADEVLRTCGLPAEAVLAGLRFFDITRTEVVAGQFLDVSAQARASRDVDLAMTVLRYKSAKYSIERPLHVGAALAGGSREQIEALSTFGVPLGEAFQLRDDLLGIFGDPAVTGKPAGDDLREGKRTVLTAIALQNLDEESARHLDASLGTHLDEDEIGELCGLIDSSGARAHVEGLISTLTAQSLEALARAPITAHAREVLGDLAQAATQRSV
ncbi:MAG: polyprenyl synthetase family protein [Marmoricola sp.]